MKPLNLLSRAEMKKVTGGSRPAGCIAKCPGGKDVTCFGTTCTAQDGSGCFGAGPGEDDVDEKKCKKDEV